MECSCCNGTKRCLGIVFREKGEGGCDCQSEQDCPTMGHCVLCVMDDFEPLPHEVSPELKRETMLRFAGLILQDIG